MKYITIKLTEDQAVAILQSIEAYKLEIHRNDWRKTGLVPSNAFLQRIKSKIRQELVQ